VVWSVVVVVVVVYHYCSQWLAVSLSTNTFKQLVLTEECGDTSNR